MKVQGRSRFGFPAALAVLPLTGVLLTSLVACSANDTTAPKTPVLNDDNHAPLQVDPPPLEDGSENGGNPGTGNHGSGGGGKDVNPPTSEPTFGEDN